MSRAGSKLMWQNGLNYVKGLVIDEKQCIWEWEAGKATAGVSNALHYCPVGSRKEWEAYVVGGAHSTLGTELLRPATSHTPSARANNWE